MAPKRLADLTRFFSLEKARATLVSDVKLDDALCLWVFLMQNFARPAHHEVDIDLYVTGVQDGAAAVCLAQHIGNAVFEAARADGRSLCKLNFRALASRRPARAAPRHEQDTYAPYRDNASGFPQADERLLYWQDLPKEARCADFVGVIAQFFNFEVVDDQGQISDELLDFIVPNANGILAFQSGFNTRVSSKLEETLWQRLSVKVEKAGAKMVFISNSFSFDKSSGKSGTAPPDAIFLQKLLERNQQLWSHLRDAGLKESGRFAVDQMAKWLSGTPMPGVDYSAGLGSGIAEIKGRYGFPEGSQQEVSEYLLKRFLSERNSSPEATNPVLSACRDLHAAATAACGSELADYLGRAATNLEKFGKTLEITDGQHFATLLQAKVPVLEPCQLVCKDSPMQPQFTEGATSDTTPVT